MFIYRFGKRSDSVNQQEDAESLPRVSVTENVHERRDAIVRRDISSYHPHISGRDTLQYSILSYGGKVHNPKAPQSPSSSLADTKRCFIWRAN